jgi:hypothetical protein
MKQTYSLANPVPSSKMPRRNVEPDARAFPWRPTVFEHSERERLAKEDVTTQKPPRKVAVD